MLVGKSTANSKKELIVDVEFVLEVWKQISSLLFLRTVS